MKPKALLTNTLIVTAGVLIAGMLMSQARNLPGVEMARDGFQ